MDKWTKLAIAIVVPGGGLAMIAWWLYNRCAHEFGYPITRAGYTYIVCLKCTRKYVYDMKTMKVGKELICDRNSVRITGSRAIGLDRPVDQSKTGDSKATPDLRQAPAKEDPDR